MRLFLFNGIGDRSVFSQNEPDYLARRTFVEARGAGVYFLGKEVSGLSALRHGDNYIPKGANN
jgi:hypothetical protein